MAYFPRSISKKNRWSGILLVLWADKKSSCFCSSLHLLFLYLEGKTQWGWPFPPSSEYSGVYPQCLFGPSTLLRSTKEGVRGNSEGPLQLVTHTYFYFSKIFKYEFSSLQNVTTIPQVSAKLQYVNFYPWFQFFNLQGTKMKSNFQNLSLQEKCKPFYQLIINKSLFLMNWYQK